MTLGTITAIRRYPVKSMAGETLDHVAVTPRGLVGDRGYALFDPADRKIASAKKVAAFPRLLEFRARYLGDCETTAPLPPVEIELPDGRRARSDDAACVEVLSSWFGRPVELGVVTDDASRRPDAGKYAMKGTFFDYAALHVLTETALAAAGALAPGSVFDVARFRPNLVITSESTSDFPENEWVGRRLRIGADLVIEISDPCPRCVMTTLPQGDLPHDPDVLKTLARGNTVFAPVMHQNEPCLGAYAFVKTEGAVRVGDPIEST